MGPDEPLDRERTRRTALTLGGSLVSTGLLAGCAGSSDGTSTAAPSTATPTTTSESPTEPPTTTPAEATTDRPTASPTPTYSVRMSPMGEVQFDGVPESVYTGLPNTADMAVAAGQADAINSIYFPQYHGTLMNNFYDRLPGVSLDWEGLTDSWRLGQEGFFDLDSDVHLTDPAYASTLEGLDADAVETIGERVGPWWGNYYSDRHREPPAPWHEGYTYYPLWEIFERTAAVFGERERAQALRGRYRELRSRIERELPPEDERPSVALTFKGKDDVFYVYHRNDDGFLNAHTRPLGATDAFGETAFDGPQRKVDYEGMLEADPDVILVLFTLASSYSIEKISQTLADDPVASEISAVQHDRVHAQGARYQGPLLNLFQLEMTAKQLYPDVFGAWPGYEDGTAYPELPPGAQLFDRERVASIVADGV